MVPWLQPCFQHHLFGELEERRKTFYIFFVESRCIKNHYRLFLFCLFNSNYGILLFVDRRCRRHVQAASMPAHQHDRKHLRVLPGRPRLGLRVLDPVLHRIRTDLDESHQGEIWSLPSNQAPRGSGKLEFCSLVKLFFKVSYFFQYD